MIDPGQALKVIGKRVRVTVGEILALGSSYWKPAVGAAALLLVTGGALAQNYPSRPVTIVLPYPTGGPTDLTARFIAQKLSERMGQPFLVENRPGGLAMVGTDRVAKAAPDGYTLLFTPPSPITIVEHQDVKSPYRAATDLVPIGQVATATLLVLGKANGPHDLASFATHARANPGKVFYGSTGLGNEIHLNWELVRAALKVDVTPVPYQGGGPALLELLAGRIDVVLTAPAAVRGYLADGRMRALATLSPKRLTEFPDVPTLAESGLQDVSVPGSWVGLLAPAATPPQIITQLRQALAQLTNEPSYRSKLTEMGLEAPTVSPEEFPALVQRQRLQWGELMKTVNIRLK